MQIKNILYSLGLVRTGNYLIRFTKLSLGFYRKFFMRSKICPKSWWDEKFYVSNILDKNTISDSIDVYSAAYHYASIELLITKELFRLKKYIKLETIVDIGTGAGHWINFYQCLGAKNIYGIDISEKVISYLRKKYIDSNVHFINGTINNFQNDIKVEADLVNAIGVMFHIVDDKEWRISLEKVHKILKNRGLFIVSGYFGLLNGLNVQIDTHGVNKRLRSYRNWVKTLREIGFDDIKVVKNKNAYNIKRALPENNILIALKK